MALRGRSKYLMFWSLKERKTGREGEKRKGEEGRRRRGRGGEPRSSKAKLQKGMELLTLSMDAWILYGLHGIVSFICLNACLQT